MDWLERESKTGKSLIIDLTRADDDDSSTDDSSASSEHNSDDSNYMEGVGDSKPRHKKRTSHNKQKHSDEGDCPPNLNDNLEILSSVGGDDSGETSNDEEEEISVNESTECNTNFQDDLLNELYGKSLHNVEVEVEDVQDGQQHRDKTGGLEERQHSDESQQSPRESEQETDDKEQQIKIAVHNLRRRRSYNSGKTLCLKVKGNN